MKYHYVVIISGVSFKCQEKRLFYSMNGISKEFSNCGLHIGKYTKYSPNKNFVNRA
jgi:hypothetical protein